MLKVIHMNFSKKNKKKQNKKNGIFFSGVRPLDMTLVEQLGDDSW